VSRGEALPAPLLSVQDLAVSFATEGGALQALDGVSFDIPAGRTVALVGESGCGKTVTALSIMRLLPTPPASIDRGRVLFRGEDVLRLPERDMQRVRGGKIAMVFQEPHTALDPVYSVGAQIIEAIRLHERMSRSAARSRAVDLLHRVGFPRPKERIDSFPHELSGGMRQRVLIAMALAAGPELLIADEPTTALDTTLKAQIIGLLEDLQRELGMSLLLIAHDLALVAEIAHEIVVMYAGVVVESGPPSRLLREPRHPYTRALLRSVPPAGNYRTRGQRRAPLPTLEGALPDLRVPPQGCRFHDRCAEAEARCRTEVPRLADVGGARVRCLLAEAAPLPRAQGGSP
jgi:oligopeptide/dipeptide ABC transporter ATP-binding protein